MMVARVLLDRNVGISEAGLRAIAHMPTKSLPVLLNEHFGRSLQDADFMRIAVYLAEKSRSEGGCPIGAVIVDNVSRLIVGKGHNRLVQDNDPYNHGETAAIHDAGRIDFSRTTLYTSLIPCEVCAALIRGRGFARLVVGNLSNGSGTEVKLRAEGIQVDILEDQRGIDLYATFRREDPALDLEDWRGLAGEY